MFVLLLVAQLGACEDKAAEPPKMMTGLDVSYDPGSDRTEILLPSTRKLRLNGKFGLRDSFWPDTAAVFGRFSIWVLTETTSSAQLMHSRRGKDVSYCPGPAFSSDDMRLYAWLDSRLGLTSIDVSSGIKTSILRLPMHATSYEGYQHYEPFPVADGPTVVETEHWLIALLQEESNDECPKDDVHFLRQGGHFVAFAHRNKTDQQVPKHPARQMKGEARSWAWSRSRKELYIVAENEGETTVGVYRLNGDETRLLQTGGFGQATRVVLSPDEAKLIVERGIPDQPQGGGFVTIDLSSGDIQECAQSGWGAAWSPNGSSIVYLDDWRLLQFDCATQNTRIIVSHEPPIAGGLLSVASGPSWSRDGTRVAVTLGSYANRLNGRSDAHTLFLDFDRHEAVLVDDICPGVVWSPIPRPIGAK